MRYKIYGVKNPNLRRKIRDALYYFENELKLNEYNHVIVKVKVTKTIDAFGYCFIEYFDDDDNPCDLIMEIQTGQSENEMFHTIAHEMVHIRQYVTGQLNCDLSVWRGHSIDSDAIHYDDHPWEIEAEEIGDKIFESWKKHETIRQ